ncbi:hypothetical protein ACHAXT_011600 [Thalassiosira profunda]
MSNPASSGQGRRKRGQRQRKSPAPPPATSESVRAEAAIREQIYRMELANWKIYVFNKVALGIAIVCMAKNVLVMVDKRRGGGGGMSGLLGEAFQHGDALGRKKHGNGLWSFLGMQRGEYSVPKRGLQPFGAYPNVLNITSEMRSQFHPIIKIPLRKGKRDVRAAAEEGACLESESKSASCDAAERKLLNETYDYVIKDYTGQTKGDNKVLLEDGKRVPQLVSSREEALKFAKLPKKSKGFDVGRYDEDRRGGSLYTSSLFLKEGSVDERTRRTIHIGLDIGAPVGTAVHAFEDGIVHSAGYNPDLGDYGHVIVIEHRLKNRGEETKVYALYGHLAARGIKGKQTGQQIRKGQVVGYLGNTVENGGWTGAHVHFQLAVSPPPTHDMPGVVTSDQRAAALLEYPDPRYVVGELW